MLDVYVFLYYSEKFQLIKYMVCVISEFYLFNLIKKISSLNCYYDDNEICLMFYSIADKNIVVLVIVTT